ncbi:hypothetical protein ACQ858_07660 [Variovorax ureilyticus]|uniref:hypothetical protein n=1 Tax=Variovorax ureilyticus TaxID=1836198 RepID=UPI003D66F946
MQESKSVNFCIKRVAFFTGPIRPGLSPFPPCRKSAPANEMKPTSTDTALLENALLAIEKVLAHADNELWEGAHFGLSIDSPLEAIGGGSLSEAQRFRGSAAQSAVNICLSAAAALVDVSKALMSAPGDRSPEDLEREWQALITHTKIASRTAHRAALILAQQEDALSARGFHAATAGEALALSLAH